MPKMNNDAYARSYRKAFFSSSVVSLFWALLNERRKAGKFPLQQIAEKTGIDKAKISRDFSGNPNWTIATMVDIGDALDVDLEIRARDRKTGQIFAPSGPISSAAILDARAPTNPSTVKSVVMPQRIGLSV